jgi:uncharacterized RDD family membrane protein YckC
VQGAERRTFADVNPPSGVTVGTAGLARRGLSLLYEALLLVAVLLVAMFPAVALTDPLDPWTRRHLIQLYLLVVSGVYFVWQWTRGGQTLAMRTWRLRLVTRSGARLRWPQALCRYLLALAGLAALGIGFLWAIADRDRQFLHDRLAGTRIVQSAGRRLKNSE